MYKTNLDDTRWEEMEVSAERSTEAGVEKMMLEFVEQDDGKLVLRAAHSDEAPLVAIEFSDEVRKMLGADSKYIGQHMIHAAIQSFMQRQVSQWHANVYDEEPVHFS
ncbi:hypothetical protein [Moraxella atlantae]|uniref:Uncharacterized protein n=1 Tax=Faucicola atlantae TaxID=34059 RepID=A0A378Q1B1_9GAMM|nr:hypothetical protein [Moraxella atlantae]OPH36915.1 hypothetical protein B5J92_02440 [Moraxella atlantae]STY94539.1 Uncharacterised protein [Moraxella atlantae]